MMMSHLLMHLDVIAYSHKRTHRRRLLPKSPNPKKLMSTKY